MDQTMNEGFTGHWLVTEYVFHPNGQFAGIIQQRRILEPRPDGSIRVIQQCTPSHELSNHPMSHFRGEWVFDLKREGTIRHYMGPDVVGYGIGCGENLLIGRGVWPHFGHNFTSFSVLTQADRQITGGKFFNAAEMVANIIGVAVPETHARKDEFPELALHHLPERVNLSWIGRQAEFMSSGDKIGETLPIQRRYALNAWQDSLENTAIVSGIELHDHPDRIQITGSIEGIAKRSGGFLEYTGIDTSGASIEAMTILDLPANTLLEVLQRKCPGKSETVLLRQFHPGEFVL